MSDLATTVRAIAFEETPTGHKWAYEHLTSQPGEPLSDRGRDLREWGYLYGLAYGIARGENPYEPNAEAAERAYQAAIGVFNDPVLRNVGFVKAFESGQLEGLAG